MQTDYSYEGDEVFFKHEISKNLSRDAYSMHSHNMYELLYFVSGDATHVIEDRQYKLKPGDLDKFTPEQIEDMKALAAKRVAEVQRLYKVASDVSF